MSCCARFSIKSNHFPYFFHFSLALIIGVVLGTYSSIHVADALSLVLGLKRSDLAPSKKVADE
ncbi:MAG: hypothetical protein GKR77_00970 [Legionellales bacterium]|nr:hypothetical protein [Legionellales bacterium]